MHTHQDHRIWDAWYYVDNDHDVVHLFYVAQPRDLDGWRPVVEHAVSKNLVDWEMLPPALRQGPNGSWDDLVLCTGSVIRRQDRYWMAYAATSTATSSSEEPFLDQRAGMAWSDDLVNWQKLAENPVSRPAAPHYEQLSSHGRKMAHWRDPFLLDCEELDHGEYVYKLLCARRRDGDEATRGSVGLARSRDMCTWELMPPLEHDRIGEEMEVPQVYCIDGRWYLIFCTCGRFLSVEFASRFLGDVPERTNFSMVGDGPLGPFHLHGTGQIVPHGADEYFYAAQLVTFRGKWYLLATIHTDDRDSISNPIPVVADATGVHALV
jgi:beta-fructofuranosidase